VGEKSIYLETEVHFNPLRLKKWFLYGNSSSERPKIALSWGVPMVFKKGGGPKMAFFDAFPALKYDVRY
jgi:hypothetical protein